MSYSRNITGGKQENSVHEDSKTDQLFEALKFTPQLPPGDQKVKEADYAIGKTSLQKCAL